MIRPLPPLVSLQEWMATSGMQMDWDDITGVIVLSKGEDTVRLLPGSRWIRVNGQIIELSSPVQEKEGNILLPSDFPQKVTGIFGKKQLSSEKNLIKIVIDPGHGGKDPGAIGVSGVFEKDIVLDIARRLRKQLQMAGIEVKLTRDRDIFIPLDRRAEVANRWKADLFVSIHANANPSHRLKGLEVYFLRNGALSRASEIVVDSDIKRTLHNFTMEKNNPVLDNIVYDMLYEYKQGESSRLARHLSTEAAVNLQTSNLGAKEAGFRVLKKTFMPAVLVEVGFLSNKKEEALLRQRGYRQKIADSLAQSIIQYVKGQQIGRHK